MEFNNVEGTNLHADVDGYSVFTVPDYAVMMHWTRLQEWRRGSVYFDVPGEFAPDSFTPARARELAGALLRAAEEAEDAVVPDEFDDSQCSDECPYVLGLCDHYNAWERASMRKAWRGVRTGLENVAETLDRRQGSDDHAV
jgi:hypothetical protein